MDVTFSYGSKRVKYKPTDIYVEPVDNLHDLTLFERRLDAQGVSWAVFLTKECKFALIAQGWQSHD